MSTDNPGELVVTETRLLAEPVYTERDRHLSDRTRQRIIDSVPPNTRRAYTRQWDMFTAWCERAGRVALPATPETLAEYVTALADHGTAVAHGTVSESEQDADTGASPALIEQAIAAIRTGHRAAGYAGHPDTNAARQVLRDHRRKRSDRGQRAKKAIPITIELLRPMVEACDTSTPKGLRDRVILVIGFALMGRRSELAGLYLEDLTETQDGLVVLIRASKTDQAAVGVEVPLPYGQHAATCPVRVVRAWREALAEKGIASGRLLRSISRHGRIGDRLSTTAVRDIVRRCAKVAGLPNADQVTTHGLRAGAPSSAYRAGVPVSAIAEHGRWAPGSPVVLGYVRTEDLWRNNPLAGIGM